MGTMLKRALLVLALALALLVVVLVGNTLRKTSKQVDFAPIAVDVESGPVAARLAAAVQLKTISHQNPADNDPAPFLALHALWAEQFPRAHAALAREAVAELSLLYTWRGSEPKLDPVVMLCHTDVVPVTPGTEDDWTRPPYSGAIADGYIYGRGTMDDKMHCAFYLEAIELLLAEGFAPRRTLLLAMGHDEETGGTGAIALRDLILSRGMKPHFVSDEAFFVVDGKAVGIEPPIAFIGVTEKGYATFELRAEGAGGHSSTPPKETSVGILSRAVHRVESNPLPASLAGVTAKMFEYLGPELPFAQRLGMANSWLLGGLIASELAKSNAGNALLRTTTAPTMLRAGVKENVLAPEATAVINFRIKPGDSIESVRAHIERVVDDERVEVRVLGMSSEPRRVSSTDTRGFSLIQRTTAEILPDAIVTPQLVIAATDARHWAEHSDAIYNFIPLRIAAEDAGRLHGTDERIPVKDLGPAVAWYRRLFELALAE
jgi:carboxypeptidase PM20D1